MTTSANNNSRIESVDILRGIVMIIMALDHTREFFHIDGLLRNPVDLATTTPVLFGTRWITHFCAPIFVFLSGISAAISMQRRHDSTFLLKRGLWLIGAELTIITFGITFNPLFNVIILQVIWAIGISMILLSFLHRLSNTMILIIGLVIVVGHDALAFISLPETGAGAILLKVFLTSPGSFLPIGGNYFIAMLYSPIPWAGIMLIGFSVSRILYSTASPILPRKLFLRAGICSLLFFVMLRYANLYGDPFPWSEQPTGMFTFLSFINVSKYPPSLLFTLLTVGAGMVFLGIADQGIGRIGKIVSTYGRVPFFYYILHFYLIHVLLLILFFATGYGTNDIVTQGSPFLFRPATFGFSLPITYVIWAIIVASLYLPCRWYANYKTRNKEKWWLAYI